MADSDGISQVTVSYLESSLTKTLESYSVILTDTHRERRPRGQKGGAVPATFSASIMALPILVSRTTGLDPPIRRSSADIVQEWLGY